MHGIYLLAFLFFLKITHICLPSSLITDRHHTSYQYLTKFPLIYKYLNFEFHYLFALS